jgi:diguanylate cyclase (GGDEF)-like protein
MLRRSAGRVLHDFRRVLRPFLQHQRAPISSLIGSKRGGSKSVTTLLSSALRSPDSAELTLQHADLATENKTLANLLHIEQQSGLLTRFAWDALERAHGARPGSVDLLCDRTHFVMLDVDNFKRVVNEHGHVVGGHVLHQVGSEIALFVREYEAAEPDKHKATAFRYGGDEFLVLLRTELSAGYQEARAFAVALCDRLAHRRFGEVVEQRDPRPMSTQGRLSESIPIAHLTASFGIGKTLKDADKELMATKNANMCTCACTCVSTNKVDSGRPCCHKQQDALAFAKSNESKQDVLAVAAASGAPIASKSI